MKKRSIVGMAIYTGVAILLASPVMAENYVSKASPTNDLILKLAESRKREHQGREVINNG